MKPACYDILTREVCSFYLEEKEVLKNLSRTWECDGLCNTADCRDEAVCNGYRYGIFCQSNSKFVYVGTEKICDGVWHCDDYADEKLCEQLPPASNLTCMKDSGNFKLVPIFNFTRCSAMSLQTGLQRKQYKSYCLDHRDQTNCSDPSRGVWPCRIDGHLSTVSEHALCLETENLCDDGTDNMCVEISKQCTVHKHQLCDGRDNCGDNSDESSVVCKSMTRRNCSRIYRHGQDLKIPISWLKDGYADCESGIDEMDVWHTCQAVTNSYIAPEDQPCKNVFICRENPDQFVTFDTLCDGRKKCSSEQDVCRVGERSFIGHTFLKPIADTYMIIPPRQHFIYCLPGLQKSMSFHSIRCHVLNFHFPHKSTLGLFNPATVNLPVLARSCAHMFGDVYVKMSCSGKCGKERCPLKSLKYDSCKDKYKDRELTRTKTVDHITFLTRYTRTTDLVRHNYIFDCQNGRCLEYHKVCDLVDDCGNNMDEKDCDNQFVCNTTGRVIPVMQVCNGKPDCQDYSDECNRMCDKEIITGKPLKVMAWIIGVSAVVFNVLKLGINIADIRFYRTLTVAKVHNSFTMMIHFGDLLTGAYLLSIAIVDLFIYSTDYCHRRLDWLTSSYCSSLGVISTMGTQISLFSMTYLSISRAARLNHIGTRSSPGLMKQLVGIGIFFLIASFIMAYIPMMEFLEDMFVNGMTYDPKIRSFEAIVDKPTHIKLIRSYHGKMRASTLPWKKIHQLIEAMFTKTYGGIGRKKLHFYGNDGVCLFKYFVKADDPQRVFVWTSLAINFGCFLIIAICYSYINIAFNRTVKPVIRPSRKRRQSYTADQQRKFRKSARRERHTQTSIAMIIFTDFICWIPFIIICGLHSLGIMDASSLYPVFSLIVLPINSVINPILYDSLVNTAVRKLYSITKSFVINKIFLRIAKKIEDYRRRYKEDGDTVLNKLVDKLGCLKSKETEEEAEEEKEGEGEGDGERRGEDDDKKDDKDKKNEMIELKTLNINKDPHPGNQKADELPMSNVTFFESISVTQTMNDENDSDWDKDARGYAERNDDNSGNDESTDNNYESDENDGNDKNDERSGNNGSGKNGDNYENGENGGNNEKDENGDNNEKDENGGNNKNIEINESNTHEYDGNDENGSNYDDAENDDHGGDDQKDVSEGNESQAQTTETIP